MKHWLLLILTTMLVLGCNRNTLPTSALQSRDSVTIVREKLVPVEVPGATVVAPMDWDSLQQVIDQAMQQWQPGERMTIIERQGPDMRAALDIYIDSLGNLVAASNCREQELLVRVRELETTVREKEKLLLAERQTLVGRMEKALGRMLLWVLLIVAVVTAGGFVIKRFVR